MKQSVILLFICVCRLSNYAQPSLPDTVGDQHDYKFSKKDGWTSRYHDGHLPDSGILYKEIPDGKWITRYKNGKLQFIRNYSAEKWQQFQNEITRYHPKRICMPITKLYHDNKKQASVYTAAINSFCAIQNCERVKETRQQLIDNNAKHDHYHPPFENGLLHGQFINYFADGAVKDSGNYKDGLPEGIWIKWTDDKQFYWKGHYHHGKKNKEWKLYTANGKLLRIVSYREGELLWRKDLKEGIEIAGDETVD